MTSPGALTAQRFRPMVPAGFQVPEMVDGPGFRLSVLQARDVVMDYVAVMSSVAELKGLFDPEDAWPDGLTMEQNLVDLGWHEKEFQRRTSFAYKLTDPAGQREWGCVYLYPSRGAEAEVDLVWWTVTGLDPALAGAIDAWVPAWTTEVWPFASVAMPGRTASG